MPQRSKPASGLMHRAATMLAWNAVRLLSLLPLRLLYPIADIAAGMLHSVIRYRRKVVGRNLKESFPHRSDKELRSIERRFYRWLCDYGVETIKLATMSRRQMQRRMRFEGIEAVNSYLKAGRHVSLYLGHYCNWEWVSSMPLSLYPHRVKAAQIYHPLENRVSDEIFLRLRSRFKANSVAMADTLRTLARWRHDGEATVTGYIADQVPGYPSAHYWTDFLRHDTPVFSGAERLSRAMHAAVFYIDMRRDCRGRYTARFIEMSPDATREPEFLLTERYFRMLELTIERAPEFWLWSHRRWKRTREGFHREYPGKPIAERGNLFPNSIPSSDTAG